MRIAVYGASGFQAALVIAELVRRGHEPLLVGRNPDRLRAAAGGAPCRVAAVEDHAALAAAFGAADAVVNCAGPFTPTGRLVIRAALAAQRPYVDTSGEQRYIAEALDTLGPEAERAGVPVVPATNDACVPGDLVASLLAARLGPLADLTVSHFIDGGGVPSRGTLRSVVATADAIGAGGLGYEDGTWRYGVPQRTAAVTRPGAAEPTRVARLPLTEAVTIPRHVKVRRVETLVEAELAERLGAPLDEAVIATLPDGPGADLRAAQRFTYLLDAVAESGRRARAVIDGSDTYGTTAVIAVECALRLARDGAAPGVLTPAQAFPPEETLAALPLTWRIDVQ